MSYNPGTLSHTSTKHTFTGCSVYRDTSTQTITTSVSTAIQFNNEQWDTDSIHDNVTNNTRLTIPTGKGGKWRFSASAEFSANTTGTRSIWFRKNGSNIRFCQQVPAASTGNTTNPLAETVLELAAGDYVEIMVFQDSGGDRTLSASATATWAVAEYLGA